MKYGIQPVPPSERATRSVGYSLNTRDHSRSAAAWQMFSGCRVIITSIGASGAVMASWPDEPRWMLRIVSVSTIAFHIGSQWSEWKLGSPRVAGFSVKVSEWQPISDTRRISWAVSSGSHSIGMAIGMNRSG